MQFARVAPPAALAIRPACGKVDEVLRSTGLLLVPLGGCGAAWLGR